ncbi:sulfotransferase 2A8-like [Amblyomma americanum]
MNWEAYKNINGVPLLQLFPDANVLSAMKYEPRPNDVIVVTYPKCGTTWTGYIVSNILTKGSPPTDPGDYMLYAPYIELLGAEAAIRPARQGPLITHLPLKNMVFSKTAKYVYVTRNPYDCCVSFYYFLKGMTPKSYADVSFESFFDNFISGKVVYGGYFDHLLVWYNLRDEANVLFLTYEQLKQDAEGMILKIADFLGEDHGTFLREDRGLLDKILESTSLRNMKAVFDYSPLERIRSLMELSPEKSLKSFDAFRRSSATRGEMHEGAGYVRKGIVGDWKMHFTQKQVTRMKQWIGENTEGTDVMDLWNHLDLP